jgi:hypothetical protein
MKGTKVLIAAVIAVAIGLNGLADGAISHHPKRHVHVGRKR